MFRSNCSVQLGNYSLLEIQSVAQRSTALGPTQTPNRPIPTSLTVKQQNTTSTYKKDANTQQQGNPDDAGDADWGKPPPRDLGET